MPPSVAAPTPASIPGVITVCRLGCERTLGGRAAQDRRDQTSRSARSSADRVPEADVAPDPTDRTRAAEHAVAVRRPSFTVVVWISTRALQGRSSSIHYCQAKPPRTRETNPLQSFSAALGRRLRRSRRRRFRRVLGGRRRHDRHGVSALGDEETQQHDRPDHLHVPECATRELFHRLDEPAMGPSKASPR